MKAIVFILLNFLMYSCVHAQAPKNIEARSIMEKMDKQQRLVSHGTFSRSQISSCKFGTKNKKISCVETPRVKLMESVSKQYGINQKDGKHVSILLEPASERGIGMLSYTYDDKTKDSESWLYLSALGKVKRLASGASQDQEPTAIFGSEFSTEDMESGKTDEYSYKILQQGAYKGREVWVIESTPTKERLKKSHYSKILVWVDQERLVPLKVQNYDKYGKLYKKMVFSHVENIKGFWIAKNVTIINMKSQRLSHMKTQDIALGVKVDEAFLTQRTLTDFAFREKYLSQLRLQVQ